MKRSSTSEESSDSKRFEAFSPQLYQQQDEKYQALQWEVQQYAANQQQQQQQQRQQQSQQQQSQQQQQQQLQAQQLDATHQQQMQQYAASQQYASNQQVQSPQGTQSYSGNQQISTAQQQQQFNTNQQYYNPAAYYTMNSMNSMGSMNSMNYSQFAPPPPPSPAMYNTSPSWNFMSPSFYATTPPPPTPCQPPLPPPDLKPEKPPLPKEPEPGTEGSSSSVDSGGGTASASVYNGMSGLDLPRAQNPLGAIRLRGLNGMNTGFNSFNGGLRGLLGGRSPHLQSNNNAMMHKMNANLSGMRGRRRNPHFFPQMLPAKFLTPPMELQRFGDFGEFARLMETDHTSGSDKLTVYLGKSDVGKMQVNKKAKRKPMSTRYTRSKQWVREEAEAAIALEKEFNRMQRRPMLILKFPDPDLNKYIVKKYSPLIDTVHFQQPSTPRYCFVQLKEGADVDKVISTIRQIPFGTGKITAELKNHHVDDQPVTPEGIDPYTLYIGNLPTHISVRVVKQYFPNAQRIDIGYAQRMRYTRYAFIRYNTVAEAMDSYKRTVNALLDSRSLIVRFRRQKGNIGLPGEAKKTAALQDGKETPKSPDPKGLEPDESAKTVAAQDSEPVEEDADDDEDDETAELQTSTSNGKNASVKPNASIKSVSPAISSADTETRSSTCTPLESKPKISKDIVKPSKPSKPSIPSDDLSDSESKEGRASVSPAAQESFESDAESKDRVLDEANDLMKKKMDLSYRRSSISASTYGSFAKPPGHVEGDIKLEETDDDSSDDGGINLLGTRVKDEPCEEPNRPPTPSMEDIYLDDYEYDDLDCEPEEEDDEWATNSETTDWDEVRRNELAVRELKPDLEQLSNTNDFTPTEEVPPIPADLEPKPEFENFFDPPTRKKNKDIFNKKDDLRDMFAQLNSDPECDEEDAFFN